MTRLALMLGLANKVLAQIALQSCLVHTITGLRIGADSRLPRVIITSRISHASSESRFYMRITGFIDR